MIHERIVVPIRTNRNKLNSSVPFKVSVSGSTKPTIYYDLATGFLKFKIRMTEVNFDVFTLSSGKTQKATGDYDTIYVPTLTPHFIDYLKGYLNVIEDDEEIQYSYSDINNEDMCNHQIMVMMINEHPCKNNTMRHIYPQYNGCKSFEGRLGINEQSIYAQTLNTEYASRRRFQNKIRFDRETADTFIATIYVPLSNILECATHSSLICLKLMDLDLHFLDLVKFIDSEGLEFKIAEGADFELNQKGDYYVTTNNASNNLIKDNQTFVCNFKFKELEVIDCDMTIDQFEVSDSSELSKIPNTQKGLVLSQLDNHVVDMDPSLEINKYTIRCPFKPASCYIYFTYDNDVNLCNRTDFLYLNPVKYLNVKTLTGYSTTYPWYDNNSSILINDPKQESIEKETRDKTYPMPDPRHFEELYYCINKFDTPLFDYDSFANVHRIYGVDMNTHLNLSNGPNELIFEVGLEQPIEDEDHVRMHIIFEREYE